MLSIAEAVRRLRRFGFQSLLHDQPDYLPIVPAWGGGKILTSNTCGTRIEKSEAQSGKLERLKYRAVSM